MPMTNDPSFFSQLPRLFNRGLALVVLAAGFSFLIAQDMMPLSPPQGTPPDTTQRPDTLTHGGIPVFRDTTVRPVNMGYDNGYAAGWSQGERINQSHWFRIGCGGGCILPCIGGGGAYVFARNAGDYPVSLPEGDSLYRSGFSHGYFDATRDKKGSAAITGALFGSGVTVGAAALYFLVIRPLFESLDINWPDF